MSLCLCLRIEGITKPWAGHMPEQGWGSQQ